MDEEIAYRDNFLYNLKYFEDNGMLSAEQIEEIRLRFVDEDNEESLLSINKKLEEVIGIRHNLEGQIRDVETSIETLSYPLVVEPAGEKFTENYNIFMKLFLREDLNYDGNMESAESFITEDYIDRDKINSIIAGKELTKLNKALIKFNNSYLSFDTTQIGSDSTSEVDIKISGGKFKIIFSKESSIDGYDQGGPVSIGGKALYIQTKSIEGSVWNPSYANLFEIEKA